MSPARWGDDPSPGLRHLRSVYGLDREQPVDTTRELHVEACKNARLLSKICDLLEGGQDELALREIRSHIYQELPRPVLPIDYDPDIHGWPWETDV